MQGQVQLVDLQHTHQAQSALPHCECTLYCLDLVWLLKGFVFQNQLSVRHAGPGTACWLAAITQGLLKLQEITKLMLAV